MDWTNVKGFIDWVSISVTLTTMISFLPPIAATVSIVWGLLRIWDWFENRRDKKE